MSGPGPIGSGVETEAFEARAAFLLRLRERGVRDLAVLRAMEAVPRALFVLPQHAVWASRDVTLPTACGQSVPHPLFLSRLLSGSRLHPDMRVLAIGLGSGYGTAVLAHLVREVVAIDRFRTLVDAAKARFQALGLDNIEARLGDGFDLPDQPPFDRILVFAVLDPLPAAMWRQVREGGAVVHGRTAALDSGRPGQMVVRVERQRDGIGKQTIIGASRFLPLRPGIAARL